MLNQQFVVATLAPPTVEVETKTEESAEGETEKTEGESKDAPEGKKEESSEDKSK